jgi:hypothetical protein
MKLATHCSRRHYASDSVVTVPCSVCGVTLYPAPIADPELALPPSPPPAYVVARLATCSTCDHAVFAISTREPVRCAHLIATTGRAGLLMHPRGIPNRQAKCPRGEWGEE